MRKIAPLTLAAALAFSAGAFAQESTITVDLSGISADLATELGIDVDDVPGSVELSAALAATVCGGTADTVSDPCIAIVSTPDLIAALDEDDDESAPNSARAFAPGQQDGPARDFAPGQQEGHAKDSAPGQMKKDD